MRKSSFDRSALYLMIILILIGIIMLMSTSSVVGYSNYKDPYYYMKRHGVFLWMGCMAFWVGYKVPHTFYKKTIFWGMALSVILLALTLIPGIGVELGGARRWLNLGVLNMQPVEVAKFFVIVFVATSICHKKSSIRSLSKGLFPLLGVVALPLMFLIKQPDLGNTMIISSVTLTLLFLGNASMLHLCAMVGSALLVAIGSVLTHPYQLGRVYTFLFPWRDPLGKSYHIIQSFIAIGSGGFLGTGLGQSKLKYSYLPLHYSDFIFSIVCEEGGFLLAFCVIALFGALFYRGIIISFYSNNTYSFYLGIGITLLMTFQSVINMGVATGLFPVKGVPLTFISFGGTSLIMSMFYIGVLTNISKLSAKKERVSRGS